MMGFVNPAKRTRTQPESDRRTGTVERFGAVVAVWETYGFSLLRQLSVGVVRRFQPTDDESATRPICRLPESSDGSSGTLDREKPAASDVCQRPNESFSRNGTQFIWGQEASQ